MSFSGYPLFRTRIQIPFLAYRPEKKQAALDVIQMIVLQAIDAIMPKKNIKRFDFKNSFERRGYTRALRELRDYFSVGLQCANIKWQKV